MLLSFKDFISLNEAANGTGLPQKLHDFLSHLSSPTDHHLLNEVVVVGKNAVLPADKFPRASSMIAQADKDISVGNVYPHIAEGFKRTFSSMKNESPAVQRSHLKTSMKVLHEFARSRGYKTRPKILGENGKTKKSTGENVWTKGISLAPHSTGGLSSFDVCPRASKECRTNCLGTEAGGNKQYPDNSLSSKILRTHFLAKHPEHFARILDHEINKHKEKAKRDGMIPGIRLNVTSDIAYEKYAPELFHKHPDVQFYDYTKMHNRVLGQSKSDHPKNYHLALSHTGGGHEESNDHHVAKVLEAGHVVASVYQRGKGNPEPTHMKDMKTGKMYPVVNGDEDDNTFDRHATAGKTQGAPGHGVVSGLKLKGVKNEAAGHFANKVHMEDGKAVIKINS